MTAQLVGKASHKPLHILVVEDSIFLRQIFFEAFRHEHHVHISASAGEGLKSFERFTPDIAFVDIGLPDASGHELVSWMRYKDPKAYVVMITASEDQDDLDTALDNRVNDYISKPFDRERINRVIEHYALSHTGVALAPAS